MHEPEPEEISAAGGLLIAATGSEDLAAESEKLRATIRRQEESLDWWREQGSKVLGGYQPDMSRAPSESMQLRDPDEVLLAALLEAVGKGHLTDLLAFDHPAKREDAARSIWQLARLMEDVEQLEESNELRAGLRRVVARRFTQMKRSSLRNQ